MKSHLSSLFRLDLRGLAVFRFALGALVLIDLVLRARDLTAHYTDEGIVPRAQLFERVAHSRWLSLHSWSGEAPWQMVLFGIAGIAALQLMLGVKTRWATLVTWILLVSLQARNPLILNGGDVLLRMLLFWSLFLPLGALWSWDAYNGPHRPPQPMTNDTPSVASAAILIQVSLMYWMTGYFKYQTWTESTSVFAQVIEFQSYAKPFVVWLLQFPALVTWMGQAVLLLEIIGPTLVFFPFGNSYLRLAMAASFALLHLGIELSMTVGLFTYVSLAAWILFLPSGFWDWLQHRWLPSALQTPTTRDERAPSVPASGPGSWLIRQGIPACLLAYIVIWNVSTAKNEWRRSFSKATPAVWNDLLLARQRWNMFAKPAKSDGWFVLVARLQDGRVVDLLRGGQPADWDSFQKPEYIYRRYPNHRWRKFYRNVAVGRADAFLSPLAKFLAASWNGNHSPASRVKKLEIHFMQQLGREGESRDRFMQRILHEEPFE